MLEGSTLATHPACQMIVIPLPPKVQSRQLQSADSPPILKHVHSFLGSAINKQLHVQDIYIYVYIYHMRIYIIMHITFIQRYTHNLYIIYIYVHIVLLFKFYMCVVILQYFMIYIYIYYIKTTYTVYIYILLVSYYIVYSIICYRTCQIQYLIFRTQPIIFNIKQFIQ